MALPRQKPRSRLSTVYEALLTPGFVDDHGDRIGQIETAAVRLHRDAQQALRAEFSPHRLGQAPRFRAENKAVVGRIADFGIGLTGLCTDSEHTALAMACPELFPVLVNSYPGELVIIEPCPPHFLVIQSKPEGLDQMQV